MGKKCYVEVKCPGVLCYMQQEDSKEQRREMRYAVISGAEVVPFVSPLATLEAREQAEAKKTGFELQNLVLQGQLHTSSASRLWLDADKPAEAKKWCKALKALATAPGAGFLWVHHGGGIWRWRWFMLHCTSAPDTASYSSERSTSGNSRTLVWYRTPGEYLRGENPIGGMR